MLPIGRGIDIKPEIKDRCGGVVCMEDNLSNAPHEGGGGEINGGGNIV